MPWQVPFSRVIQMKWLKRIFVGAAMVLAVLTVVVPVGSLVARNRAARIAARDFPPPGRLVAVEGRKMHLHCTGAGEPTIVLESGLDERGSSSWEGIRDELSQISRV